MVVKVTCNTNYLFSERKVNRENVIRNEKKLRSLNIKASALTQWLLVITPLGIIFLV